MVNLDDFAFSTPLRIYYNRKSDRVCFTGPVNALSRSAIEEAIVAHKIARLAINANVPLVNGTTSDFTDPTILDLAGTIYNWHHPELTDIVLYVSPRSVHGGYGSRMKFFWPEGDCMGDERCEQMARTSVEAFMKLDKDVMIKQVPTAEVGAMRIEELCRLRAKKNPASKTYSVHEPGLCLDFSLPVIDTKRPRGMGK